MSDLVTGSDGLPVRVVQPWAKEKLFYVNRYIDIFTTAMKDKWRHRVYIDLFAGPGRSVVEETGEEIDGSPLLAMQAKYSFTQLYFNDLDHRATDAPRIRAGSSIKGNEVLIANHDCNVAARQVPAQLFQDSMHTLGLAVIDPTAFQISLDALEEMTTGHKVNLIITLMTGFLKRFVSEAGYEQPLDNFFGGSDWRRLVDLKESGQRITYRLLLDHYEQKLKDLGYLHVDDDIRIMNSKEATIYHLVFASKHPLGANFFKRISRKQLGGQARLDLS